MKFLEILDTSSSISFGGKHVPDFFYLGPSFYFMQSRINVWKNEQKLTVFFS